MLNFDNVIAIAHHKTSVNTKSKITINASDARRTTTLHKNKFLLNIKQIGNDALRQHNKKYIWPQVQLYCLKFHSYIL